ncbi:MAG TPA: DUF255 domain-containing protein [Saprospiraceae bacterium]|nr:DUF255 domain-containing protein [Saprospiraceae bacterium]
MKNLLFSGLLLAFLCGMSAFSMPKTGAPPAELKWYTWEQAQELQKTAPRPIFVDVYTDWCGWCKRMDKTTFADSAVVAYMSAHYYPVKFDAEQKADLVFAGQTFKFQAQGARGVHEFAVALLDGKMGYPSYVYFTPKNERIMVSPGYKEAADLMKELRFAKEEKYKTTTWEKYRDGGQ